MTSFLNTIQELEASCEEANITTQEPETSINLERPPTGKNTKKSEGAPLEEVETRRKPRSGRCCYCTVLQEDKTYSSQCSELEEPPCLVFKCRKQRYSRVDCTEVVAACTFCTEIEEAESAHAASVPEHTQLS